MKRKKVGMPYKNFREDEIKAAEAAKKAQAKEVVNNAVKK